MDQPLKTVHPELFRNIIDKDRTPAEIYGGGAWTLHIENHNLQEGNNYYWNN
jgi:hypothetical protein